MLETPRYREKNSTGKPPQYTAENQDGQRNATGPIASPEITLKTNSVKWMARYAAFRKIMHTIKNTFKCHELEKRHIRVFKDTFKGMSKNISKPEWQLFYNELVQFSKRIDGTTKKVVVQEIRELRRFISLLPWKTVACDYGLENIQSELDRKKYPWYFWCLEGVALNVADENEIWYWQSRQRQQWQTPQCLCVLLFV